VKWLGGLVRGDLGHSFASGQPVTALIVERLGATLQLTVAAVLLALLVSVPIGVLSATRPYSWLDRISTLVAFLGVSFPSFWLGIMLILIFSGLLGWFPASGISEYGLERDFMSRLHHAVLPTVTLASTQMASMI